MLVTEDIGIIIIKFTYPQILNSYNIMPLQPIKDIKECKRVKELLRERDEAERTGDQDLFREQSKILEPLINTQQQTVQETLKAIKGAQDTNAMALLPFKRNDQSELLQPQLLVISPAPISPEFLRVDLDAGLTLEAPKQSI